MMKVLITRPEPEASAFAKMCERRGLKAVVSPLMVIYAARAAIDLSGVGALAFTSVNGVRAFAGNSADRQLPVFAVGETSAAEARRCGFEIVYEADGDVDALAMKIAAQHRPDDGAILHGAGATLAGDLVKLLETQNLPARRLTLYEAREVKTLSVEALAVLKESRDADWVALFSPRSAGLFVDRVRSAGLEQALTNMRAACLSDAVAQRLAESDWKSVDVAARRTADAAPEVEAEIVAEHDIADGTAQSGEAFTDAPPSAQKRKTTMTPGVILFIGFTLAALAMFAVWRFWPTPDNQISEASGAVDEAVNSTSPASAPVQGGEDAVPAPASPSKISNEGAVRAKTEDAVPNSVFNEFDEVAPPLPSPPANESATDSNLGLQAAAKEAFLSDENTVDDSDIAQDFPHETGAATDAADGEDSDIPAFELEPSSGDVAASEIVTEGEASQIDEPSFALDEAADDQTVDVSDVPDADEENAVATESDVREAEEVLANNVRQADNVETPGDDLDAIKDLFRADIASLEAELALERERNAAQREQIEEMRRNFQAALAARDSTASRQLAELNARIDRLENGGGVEAGRRAAAALALTAVRRAADNGETFADELDVLASYIPQGREIAVLRRYSEAALPTAAQLEEAFDVVARQAIATGEGRNATTASGKLASRMKSLISIRPAAPIAGARCLGQASCGAGEVRRDMRKLLIFLLWIVLLAGTITYFASLDSRITGEAFGRKFDTHSGVITGGLLFLFVFAIYATHKIKDIMGLPARIRARDAAAQRARGVAALTRGLEAVAVGDASAAAHHAKVARRHLDDMALTRLLTAQAAQLSGDEISAKQSFSAMLEAPETEFLGLKGLYLQAMAKEDRASAQEFAERAFRLRPNARWAFDSVVDLGLERGAWGETREAIDKARRNNLIDVQKADRGAAALLTADAYAALLSGDAEAALREAESALKLAKGFSPAVMLAAKLYEDNGKAGKAAKVIETAFAIDAHPALIRFFDKLYADESAEKRAGLLRKLAEKNTDTREAALLRARAHNLISEWPEAIAALEPLMTGAPTAAEYSLMATAAAGIHGGDTGKGWLERAARAPRDPRPGADGEFNLTRSGWARLVREYMEFGRLAPPPLEEMGASVSAEEIRLLTVVPEPEVEEVKPEEASMPDPESDNLEELTVGAEVKMTVEASPSSLSIDDDHIHDDEEAERNLRFLYIAAWRFVILRDVFLRSPPHEDCRARRRMRSFQPRRLDDAWFGSRYIAFHDVKAADKKPPGVFKSFDFLKPGFDAWQHFADGAGANIARLVSSEHGGGFSNAIAFQHFKAKALFRRLTGFVPHPFRAANGDA
ncbi:HemY_N domain-containing protein [Durusdinium trenchii]|uniref:HemY_N domain-containing protein n=1 Tax=Durusdinium trenchii TaxID=1381693 RepID=A0ABP0LU07_9DINO